MNLKSILFSVVYPLAFIVLLAVLTKLTGLATVDAGNLPALASFPWGETLILSFLLMFGEEYGWRGFLLKNLAEAKGKAAAAMIVGAVWAVWHAPVIYGLARVSKMGHPLLLMFIQMGAVFAFSIPFAYAYFLSRSIIPPMLFHLLWNHYNSIVFGSIYRNSHGVMKGDLLLINGEGLGGMVLGALLMLWFMRRFRKMS